MNDQREDRLTQARRIREASGAQLADILHLLTVLETDEQVLAILGSRNNQVSVAVQLFVLKTRVELLENTLKGLSQ